MKYFTPELYVRFNSDDSDVADQADAEWETATSAYRRHLQAIRDRLPESVRELAESTCLHDARYLGYAKIPVPKSSGELVIVAVEQQGQLVLLNYVLVDEPSLTSAGDAGVFADREAQWLYDEVDEFDGVLHHDILLSNGKILSLRFTAFSSSSVDKSRLDVLARGTLPAAAS